MLVTSAAWTKNAEALAEAIRSLAEQPAVRMRMGEAARAKVVPRYGLEQMVMRIEALYEELAKEKGLDA